MIFFIYDTKAQARKKKIDRQIGLHQNYKNLCVRGNYQENENSTYRMGENIYKS